MSRSSATIRTAAEIRRDFLDFFREKHGHAVVPSAPVVPHDDPTLLFTNAGMNQFKDVFLGQGHRDFTRAVDTQKCIRAGGKHNDLEDVGKDTYHHTFFEMLGNWSFGDYFKAEAIRWAWELLTDVWGLDPDRLYVSVFAGDEAEGTAPDDEAAEIWRQLVPADRISRWGKKDNFWEMGETGPCGPCSEIHYDGRADDDRAARPGADLVNRDDPRVIELWNLVFIQFNRAADGTLTPLPAKHVDTGMGLERLVRILQGSDSNYDTDLFTPIFQAIEAHTGVHPYRATLTDPLDIAYRVIADHIRCLAVAITDGARPGSDGRSYVLRRILRRAVRHAHQTLQTNGAWLHELVPAVVGTLGDAFPELRDDPDRVAGIIRDEEEAFLRTLDRGLRLFADAADRAGRRRSTCISADDAFMLHDTYGFPFDLTQVMALEHGLEVDLAGYEQRMERARAASRRTGAEQHALTLPPEGIARLRHLDIEPTRDDDKHTGRPVASELKAIYTGRDFDDVIHEGATAALILARTNHYAEQGGQVGDTGHVQTDVANAGAPPGRGYGAREASGDFEFEVHDTQVFGGYVLHIGRARRGRARVGERVHVIIDRPRRAAIRANHTATHLLNLALRAVVGEDVGQKGSLVADDRLRFDFSCSRALADGEIARVQEIVDERIAQDLAVHAGDVPLETARRIHGVRAVFGERYPDPVRVVSIGPALDELLADPGAERWHDYSIEFCGGTHLDRTAAAAHFVIISEQALAAGVRRIIALTGPAAQAARLAGQDLLDRAAAAASLPDAQVGETFDELGRLAEEMTIGAVDRHRITSALDGLRERVKRVRKAARSAGREQVVDQARHVAASADGTVIVEEIDGADQESLLSALDVIRAKHEGAAIMLLSADAAEGKVAIVAAVPEALIAQGLKAGDWVREAASKCGGGGGGRPDLARAGGRDPDRIDEALSAARTFAGVILQ